MLGCEYDINLDGKEEKIKIIAEHGEYVDFEIVEGLRKGEVWKSKLKTVRYSSVS